MSADRATSPCNKFQANIFNKSKCQNCFKPRELHLLNDHDKEQVHITYHLNHVDILLFTFCNVSTYKSVEVIFFLGTKIIFIYSLVF
uniref:Uncharacterized protein n=1 Tax=Labrus bergylta TaxID=56723 RepID=A0A3Q3EGD6_9LABR